VRDDDRRCDVPLRAIEHLLELQGWFVAENLRDGVPAERAIALELRFAEPLVARRLMRKRLRRL
jgi:hypothetical protein